MRGANRNRKGGIQDSDWSSNNKLSSIYYDDPDEVKNVYAYFIEYYDENTGNNYYIFSKDNSVEKQSKINYTTNYLNELQELREKDIAYYNEDVQVLAYPYAGYVVRGRDGTLLLLSTLWDNNSIN